MKYIYLMLAALLLASCVQPVTKRTITFTLDAKDLPPGCTAAVRGTDKPLSWKQDTPMQYDSITGHYRLTVEIATGFRFTEYKYVVNGRFEFPDGESRKVVFDEQEKITLADTFDTR
ncbi:hypothetical protein ACLI09_16440 [Flavobacterium sp. RHBU_24]|uniref:hypothetical protein n=1 Tax=Flavobacterium sp. RHBU_24 TaxID=3391185 RepID=UPI0039853265